MCKHKRPVLPVHCSLFARFMKCPFCKKFSKTVKVTYENGDWDASY